MWLKFLSMDSVYYQSSLNRFFSMKSLSTFPSTASVVSWRSMGPEAPRSACSTTPDHRVAQRMRTHAHDPTHARPCRTHAHRGSCSKTSGGGGGVEVGGGVVHRSDAKDNEKPFDSVHEKKHARTFTQAGGKEGRTGGVAAGGVRLLTDGVHGRPIDSLGAPGTTLRTSHPTSRSIGASARI